MSNAAWRALINPSSQLFLRVRNYQLTNEFMQNALHGRGITNAQAAMVRRGTQESEEFNELVNDLINRANRDGRDTFYHNRIEGIRFDTGDMHFAIQRAQLGLRGTRIGENTWSISIEMADIFDFDNFRRGWSLSDLANDVGLLWQMQGIIVPFSWEIHWTIVV